MNTKEQLAHWLATKKRDYKTGVQIFADLNIDVSRVEFFNSGDGKIQQNILARMLENYARVHKIRPRIYEKKPPVHVPRKKLKSQQMPKASKEYAAQKVERPLIDTNPSVKYDDLPENLQERFKENSRLNAEMKTLHTELKSIQDDPDKEERRKELANGIVDRQKKTRENWDVIDKWWKERNNVEKKPEKKPEELAAEEALKKDKRIKANLNYIRRYKKTTKERQKKEMESRMKELDEWGVDYEGLLK